MYYMEKIAIGNKLSETRIHVGKGLETKINLIVGLNTNNKANIEREKEKIRAGAKLGVHTIIDLSTVRIEEPLWKWGQEHYPKVAFGKVAPILVATENNGEVKPEDLLEEIKWSAEEGIDYMTMNLIPMKLGEVKIARERSFLTTSRQGGVLLNYMLRNKVNNPYEPILDDIIQLFREFNVTMHIGSTFRPMSITEAYDKTHKWELEKQMEMFRRVDDKGVQAIVEPMSHQPLSEIGPGIEELRGKYGEYVPFQMLGPITTEANLDCDQYAAASGAAIAAMHNVGKITVIPPREHVGFPSLHDTIEGIKSTLISVHAGDLCRLPHLMEEDRKITMQRKKRRSCNSNSEIKGCNKCGNLCPLLIESDI